MIELKNITYTYPNQKTPSISNIDINICRGEFVVLTGSSGCGKTTITRVINGLATKFYEGYQEGFVKVNGKNANEMELWELGKEVGSIFQDPRSQFFASLVEDEVAFGCENYGIEANEINKRVHDSIEMIHGNNLIGKELFYLSSGEKQKIGIASINALNPDIYVFDEPSANLDMYSVEKLKHLLFKLKKMKKTIIISEHRLYYLRELADRYIFLDGGMIKNQWTQKEFMKIKGSKRIDLGLRALDLRDISSIEIHKNCEDKELIKIKDLDFNYGKRRIFNQLNLSFNKGELVAINGGNGIGKTTLAKLLCGLIKEKRGKILFNGQELSQRKRRKQAYFVMKNTECQLFSESVEEELLLNNHKANVVEILSRYGLENLEDRHPSTLSGGQKQRLTLAIAEVLDRDILILDEPTSGVDKRNMRLISKRLKEMSSQGKTIIVISHDYEFIMETCERVIIMKGLNKPLSLSIKTDGYKLLEKMLDGGEQK